MSIASRINAIEEHIGNAYDKLEDLGIDLTNTDKNIDNIATKLDEIYDNYPKVTANDTQASLSTNAGRIEITPKGNTAQNTTTGINLVPMNKPTFTNASVVFNNNDNKSFTVNGTKSASIGVMLTENFTYNLKNNKNYTLAIELLEGSKTDIPAVENISIATSSNINYQYQSITTLTTVGQRIAKTWQQTEDATITGFYFYCGNGNLGTKYTNYKIRLWLVEGSYTSTTVPDFEEYTNGASPNPTYPQPIQTVSGNNNIKIQNKNIFDKTTIIANSLLKWADGTTASETGSIVSGYIQVAAGQQIVQNYYSTICFYDKNKTAIGFLQTNNTIAFGGGATLKAYTIPQNEEIFYMRLGFRVSSNPNVDLLNADIQVEYGSTASTYTAHAEQNLPINLKSKNLFDKNSTNIIQNKYLNSNGTTSNSNDFSISDYMLVEQNTNYAIQPYKGFNACVCFYDENFNFLSAVTLASVNPYLTTPNNCKYIRSSFRKTDIDLFQLEQGSTQSEYVPYWAYELCKIGTAEDYIYKDDDKWYVHKEIGKIVLDGSSDENWIVQSTNYFKCGILLDIVATTTTNSFCTIATSVAISNLNVNSVNKYASNQSYLWFRLSQFNNDVSAFKTYLSNNSITVYYQLETPTNTEITQTELINQLEALQKAKSYNEQTNISQTNNDLPFILDIKALRGE